MNSKDRELGLIEHQIPTDQGKLYAREFPGRGPAFVMMHGFPDNLHIYDDLVPFLAAAGRRIVVFDFLGFGASEKPREAQYSFAQQLADLKAVVDVIGLEQVVPVAHDSSGPAAVNFAIAYPLLTDSVVLLNTVFGNARTTRLPELIELFATERLNELSSAILQSPEQFGWLLNFQRDRFQQALTENHKAHYAAFLGPVIDNNFRQQPSSARAFAKMTGQFNAELDRNTTRIAEMEALRCPFKLIWGETDPYLNVGVAHDFKSHLPHAALHLLPAGHWVQIDEPELVATAMLANG